MTGVGKTDNLVMRANLETIQNIIGFSGLNSVLNYNGLEKLLEWFQLSGGFFLEIF